MLLASGLIFGCAQFLSNSEPTYTSGYASISPCYIMQNSNSELRTAILATACITSG